MKKEGRKRRIAQSVDQLIIDENIEKTGFNEEGKDMLRSFATRLNKELENQNIHQEDFCEKITLSDAALSKYRNGKGFPTCDIAVKIAKELNVTLDYLFGLSDVKIGNMDFYKVNKITGLSQKSVQRLKLIVTESKNDNVPKTCFINEIRTLNYLLEDTNDRSLLSSISSFLWDDVKVENYLGAETVEVTYNNGNKGVVPIPEFYDMQVLAIQRKLNEIKSDILKQQQEDRMKQEKAREKLDRRNKKKSK